MRFVIFIFSFVFLFGINYTKKEQEFLKNHPVIFISAMNYWPVDKNGNSFHINYLKLLNKYGHLNLQPVFYKYWSNGFNNAKNGITDGIMALSYSKKRTKWFYYTKAYNFTPYYLIVNKNSQINSLKDLKNKKVDIAKDSILNDTFKNRNFIIVHNKHAYKELAQKKIDAILLFYLPNTKYKNKFRVIKAFINKVGEEHIGICKKYPQLYSIIQKAMKAIPYSEIEKIKSLPYMRKISIQSVLTPEINIKNLISWQDILFIVGIAFGIIILLFVFLKKKFLNYNIKLFFIAIIGFNIFILSFIVYDLIIFNYYSNKILNIKSKSFNTLYLVDNMEKSVNNLNNAFINKYLKQTSYIQKLFIKNRNAYDLIVGHKPLKYFLNLKYFSATELTNLASLIKTLNSLISLQPEVLSNKIHIFVYRQKFIYLINQFYILKKVIKQENQKEIFIIKQKLKYQFLLLIFSIVLFIISFIFIFIMIKKKIYNPIAYLTNVIKEYQKGNKQQKQFLYYDEIGIMINEFFALQKELDKKINELYKHKQNLKLEVKKEVENRLYQEKILIKQSKFALMGEMIDAIAHQWKQPLGNIHLMTQLLELEKDNIDEQTLKQFVGDVFLQIEHMTQTLDEFRSFFNDKKEKEEICMSRVIQRVLLLLKDELLRNHIKIEQKIEKDFCIYGIRSEFDHLLITIISNARDIFKERNINNKKITIIVREDEKYYYLEIIDNARGISDDIIDKIFELNFTTRKEGTGVGLYLASKIALKHMGDLRVENIKNGAKFYFKVRKDV